MNVSEIIQDFSEIQPAAAAAALSEPFLQPESYKGFFGKSSAHIELAPAAAAVARITDDGEVEPVFAMSPETERPLACAQAFAEGYDQMVGHFHAHHAREQRAIPESSDIGAAYHMSLAVEKTKAANLRTIAAFIIFASFTDNPDAKAFVMAKKPLEEIPLEGREYMMELQANPSSGELALVQQLVDGATGGKASLGSNDILTNGPTNQKFGMSVGALHMPDIKRLKRIMAADPRVGDYFNMSRKERRLLVRQEQKLA